MRLFFCMAAALVFAAGLPARADVFQSFEASGSFENGTTLSGNVVIDTTAGFVESGDLFASGTEFDILVSDVGEDPALGLYTFVLTPNAGAFPILIMSIPQGSLVGYGGGSLCSTTNLCDGSPSSYSAHDATATSLETGTLTPSPEPSSFALLGTGMVGFALITRRHFNADCNG